MAALACPVGNCANVSTRFGAPNAVNGAPHTGLDFPVPAMTPVRAPARGIVRDVWWNAGGGRMVAITHTDDLETRYAHLTSATVRRGQVVGAGHVIAYSGASGALVRGAHLHFEVWTGGRPVDPAPFLVGAGATTPDPNPVAKRPDGTCPPGYALHFFDTSERCWRIGAPTGQFGPLDPRTITDHAIPAIAAGAAPIAANVALLVAAAMIGWGGIRRSLDG